VPANFTLIYICILHCYFGFLKGKGKQLHKKFQLISVYSALTGMVKVEAFKGSFSITKVSFSITEVICSIRTKLY